MRAALINNNNFNSQFGPDDASLGWLVGCARTDVALPTMSEPCNGDDFVAFVGGLAGW